MTDNQQTPLTPPSYQRPLLNFPVVLNYVGAVVSALLPITPLLDGLVTERWYFGITAAVNVLSALIIQRQKSMLNQLSPNAEGPL